MQKPVVVLRDRRAEIQGVCVGEKFIGRIGDIRDNNTTCTLRNGKYSLFDPITVQLKRGAATYDVTGIAIPSSPSNGGTIPIPDVCDPHEPLGTEKSAKGRTVIVKSGKMSVYATSTTSGCELQEGRGIAVTIPEAHGGGSCVEYRGDGGSRPFGYSVMEGGAYADRPCTITPGVYKTSIVNVNVSGVRGPINLKGELSTLVDGVRTPVAACAHPAGGIAAIAGSENVLFVSRPVTSGNGKA